MTRTHRNPDTGAGALAGVVVGMSGYATLMVTIGAGVLATAGYLLLDRTLRFNPSPARRARRTGVAA